MQKIQFRTKYILKVFQKQGSSSEESSEEYKIIEQDQNGQTQNVRDIKIKIKKLSTVQDV